jgi:ABC-type glycerol-3-phosphate transport system permease component
LFFPIYWVITSSFKSRESISSYPPTFYPSKPKTTNIELNCPEKVFNYNNNFWLKLSEHNNTSSYYLQLNNKFEPLEYVNIIEDKLVSLYKEKVKLNFPNCRFIRLIM